MFTTEKMSVSLGEIHRRLLPNIGRKVHLPLTRNKGVFGHWLERTLGIPHGPNCLDCTDGELKSFPLRLFQNGCLGPKESIAATMVNTEEFVTKSFVQTRFYKKHSHCLYVPYYRDMEMVEIGKPKILTADHPVFKVLEDDYYRIRDFYLENKQLKSSLGTYLQTRTKGAKDSTTRAYYLRKEFARQHLME